MGITLKKGGSNKFPIIDSYVHHRFYDVNTCKSTIHTLFQHHVRMSPLHVCTWCYCYHF